MVLYPCKQIDLFKPAPTTSEGQLNSKLPPFEMDQSSNIASMSGNTESGALATITSPNNTSGAGDEAGVGTSANDAPTSNVLINSHPLDLYVPPFGFK